MGEGTKNHVIADISSPNPNLKVKVHKSYVRLTAPSICYIWIWQLLLAPPPQITAKIVQPPQIRYCHWTALPSQNLRQVWVTKIKIHAPQKKITASSKMLQPARSSTGCSKMAQTIYFQEFERERDPAGNSGISFLVFHNMSLKDCP